MTTFAIGVDLGGTNLRIAAVDDNGKAVDPANSPAEPGDAHRAPAALKLGEKQKALKELRGNITVEAFTQIVIDDPAKNVGKSFELSDGSSFQLQSFDKKENGDISVTAAVVKAFQPGGKVHWMSEGAPASPGFFQ